MTDQPLRDAALDYHRQSPPGKLAVVATKPLNNQRDLSLAYSPGVAAACEAIAANPADAALYTARANLVAVITNGTAVLGLGSIGPLAAKPVREYPLEAAPAAIDDLRSARLPGKLVVVP